MNTRFYAKRTVDGPRAIPREVISASIRQTYNTDARSILSDADQRSRNIDADVALHAGAGARAHVAVRRRHGHVQDRLRRAVQPFQELQRRCRVGTRSACRYIASWSNVRFRPERTRREHRHARPTTSTPYTNLRFQQNRYGITHSLNWDVKNQSLTQHRIASYYNAQCCGFSAEYQFIDLSQHQQRRRSSRTRDFTFRSRSAASATSRTSSARWAAPATGDRRRASTPSRVVLNSHAR